MNQGDRAHLLTSIDRSIVRGSIFDMQNAQGVSKQVRGENCLVKTLLDCQSILWAETSNDPEALRFVKVNLGLNET